MLRTDSFGNILYTGESQRKNGTYMFRIMKWGQNTWIYEKTLDELRIKEKNLLDSIEKGYSVLNEEMTLNEVVDCYIEKRAAFIENSTLNTMYHEYYDCRNTIGRTKIKELKKSELIYYYMAKVKTEKNPKGYAISTIKRQFSVINGALKMAVGDRIISDNPANGVMKEIKSMANYKKKKISGLNDDQRQRFVEYMNNNPIYAKDKQLILFLLGTGCRIGEALALRWNDIDFKTDQISINHAVTYESENNHRIAHIKEPKTQAGNRCIPMMEDVRELLLDIKKEHASIRYSGKQEIDGYTDFVFLSNRGRIFTREAVCAKLHKIIRAYNEECAYNEVSKLPDITTHQLRHTFATFLCRSTSDLKAIQTIMGHESIVITLSVYADATEVGVFESMKAMERAYSLKSWKIKDNGRS